MSATATQKPAPRSAYDPVRCTSCSWAGRSCGQHGAF